MSLAQYITFVGLAALLTSSGATLAGEPCGAVICLSANKTAPHQCKDAVDGYFSIRNYIKPCRGCGKVFDPGGTAVKRLQEVLDKCAEARDEDRDFVTATYGSLEYSPFDYIIVDEESGDNKGYSADSKEKAVERRYLTCQEAAAWPELASKVKKDSYAGISGLKPGDATIYGADNTVKGIISDGMMNLSLGTSGGELVDGKKTPIKEEYGFAVQERDVERTVAQHTILSAGPWRTVKTGNCSVADYYRAQDVATGG